MVELFIAAQIENLEIQTIILPVAYANAFSELKKEIDQFQPDFIVCMGLAGNREQIDLEKVAINLIHSSIPDNQGVLAQDRSVVEDGPAAYFATLPLKEFKATKTPFQVEFSFSAGAYVCNSLMYQVLHYTREKPIKAGFIHLPHLRENRESIFLSLTKILSKLSNC